MTACWNGIFERNVRNIESLDPHLYVIRDSLKIDTELEVCFILNTYGNVSREGDEFLITDGDMQLRITTEGWKPSRTEFGPFGTDGDGRPVSRLCLFTGGQNEYELETRISLYRIKN